MSLQLLLYQRPLRVMISIKSELKLWLRRICI